MVGPMVRLLAVAAVEAEAKVAVGKEELRRTMQLDYPFRYPRCFCALIEHGVLALE